MTFIMSGLLMQAMSSIEIVLSEVRKARIQAEANEKTYVGWMQGCGISDKEALQFDLIAK